MNAIIQPIHLLLYTFLVSTSMSLVVKNPLYAVVAIGFMIPAEKFIKKMFGINAETTSGMGSFAGGALAMSGLQKLAGIGKNSGSKSSSSSGDEKDFDDGKKDNIKFAKQPNDDTFGSFNGMPLPDGGNDGQQENVEPQDERHQRMLDDRAEWERIANDQNASEMDRQEAQEQVNMINEDMRQSGYLPANDNEEQTQNNGAVQTQNNDAVQTQGNNNSNITAQTSPSKPVSNNTVLQKDEHWKRKLAGKAVTAGGKKGFKALKGTAKVAAKVAGGAAGATIGLAAGVATGDPTKAFTYAAGGAVAGATIAKNATNAVGVVGTGMKNFPGKFEKVDNNIQYAIDEAQYGAKYAREQKIAKENEQATQRFLRDEKEKKKWKDIQAELNASEMKTEDFMKVVADYKMAAPNMDDSMIKDALKLETEYGDKKIGGTAHKQVVDVARFTTKNGYGREYVEDKDKREVLDKHIDSKVANENDRKQIKQMHAKLNGVGHLRK